MTHAAKRQMTDERRGSGGRSSAPEPRYLVVGQIAGAHGLYGEIKVDLLTDDPHRFQELDHVFLGKEGDEPSPLALKGYRLHQGRVLLQLESCTDREQAQSLRGLLVQVPREEAIPLEEDEYFEYQILGLAVWTSEDEYLGTIEEIIYTGANEVYVIRGQAPGPREILIPAIEKVVLEVDLEAGRMTVQVPEELR